MKMMNGVVLIHSSLISELLGGLITINNILSVIPQIESREGGVYVVLPLPSESRKTVSDRPSTELKHIKNKNGKEVQY